MKSLQFAILVALFPCATQAQVNPDSIKQRNDCRLALQVVTTGRPAVKADWAVRQMRTCPALAPEWAHAFVAARSDVDTTRFNLLTSPTDWIRDAAIYSAAMDVLADQSASEVARVYAVRVLLWSFVPGEEVHYGHLVDLDGDGDWTCGGIGPSLHGELARGMPLPADWTEVARSLALRIARDETEPRAVRQASACLAHAVPMPRLHP